MKVPFSYLREQFSNPDPILRRIKKVVQRGDFTLGKEVREFEEVFRKIIGTKYAIGVNSGTDAIFLSMKVLGIGNGDEVITAVNTFIGTAGAIVATGATPVFVDCDEEYILDLNKLEAAITKKTKAIIPVHYAGHPINMPRLVKLARKHKLYIIEDACQGIAAEINGRKVGSFGEAGAFSLHPLKNINVWSDGGIITTNSKKLYETLRFLRNHGMKNRDKYVLFGYNSRLDTMAAAIGLEVVKDLEWVTKTRIKHAALYDRGLRGLRPQITLPPRRRSVRYVYHLYIIQAQRRDELLKYLKSKGVEAKVHYPTPLHLQECSNKLGYKKGQFPVSEAQAKSILTLPAHQYLSERQIRYVIKTIHNFYL